MQVILPDVSSRGLLGFSTLSNTQLLTALLLLILSITVHGQSTSVTSLGFRAVEGGGGAIYTEWTTGNMGNTWAEGEWIPYQVIFIDVQADYPNLVGFPKIIISYSFTVGDTVRFVDLERSIQVGTTQLADSQAWPRDDGSAYPMITRAQIEDAQNDIGNSGDLENLWPGFNNLNLPDSQMNRYRIDDMTFTDGTPTDAEHAFYITKQDLVDAGVPLTANTIVLYYQMHESRTFVWQNSLQQQYDQPQTDEWGGYLYSLPAYAADARSGAGYVPGSSGHNELVFASESKSVPIPIPESFPGSVSGLKWLDSDGDGTQDGDEVALSGWRVYVSGLLEGIDFADTAVTDSAGNYSISGLSSIVTWTIKEDAQRFNPSQSGFMQSYPLVGTIMGQGIGGSVSPPPVGVAGVGWNVQLTLSQPDQTDMNFGNTNNCCNTDGIRGDTDNDCSFGCVTVSDLSYLVDYLFLSGPAPACEDEGNADGDCTFGCITVGDLAYLVSFLFGQQGPPPVPCP